MPKAQPKPKQKKHGTDWEPMRIAYVNSAKTYEQIANEFGVNLSTLKSRGLKEEWTAQRNQIQQESSRNANESIAKARQEQLEAMNKADISIANGIRNEIIERLKDAKDRPNPKKEGETIKGKPIPASELRFLANSAMAAQKISRLVIGAVTEVVANEHTGANGGPIQSQVTLTDAQRQSADEIIDSFIREKQPPTE